MTKVVDINKVQEALDRAARNAERGSAKVRAGLFVQRNAKDGGFVTPTGKRSNPKPSARKKK